jgi:hypothetical protein
MILNEKGDLRDSIARIQALYQYPETFLCIFLLIGREVVEVINSNIIRKD